MEIALLSESADESQTMTCCISNWKNALERAHRSKYVQTCRETKKACRV
jgi:hypothetical protein